MLLVNTELVSAEQMPSSIDDLVDPKWQGQVGVAKPLFGTTATHAAVLVDRWGLERADKFFRDLEQNAQVLSGNKQVAVAVGKGQLAFGLTDTDDAIIERDNGRPVAIVFPDQGESGSGALFIPNTVAVIKGSKNQSAAGVLIDFLLSPAVEIALAKGQSAQFPLNSQVTEPSRAQPDFPIKHLDADFGNAADRWDETADRLKAIFHGE